MKEPSNSPFRIVGPPGVDPARIHELLQAMGAELGDIEAELFPQQPITAPCRICGETKQLTEEHIPPRGAYNKHRAISISVDAILGREDIELPEEGDLTQGGIRGFVLCAECNNKTGRWGREYQEWAGRAMYLLRSQQELPPEVDEQPGHASLPEVTFKDVYPSRLIRQVLSMMLSISGGAELGERFPFLRELVLGGAAGPLPAPLRIYFLLYGSTHARIAGGPRGQAWLSDHELRRALSVDFPPLAFVLLIEGPEINDLGIDVSSFTEWAVDRRGDIRFEDLPLGFGHKPWPADYRSKGQMLADRIEFDS